MHLRTDPIADFPPIAQSDGNVPGRMPGFQISVPHDDCASGESRSLVAGYFGLFEVRTFGQLIVSPVGLVAGELDAIGGQAFFYEMVALAFFKFLLSAAACKVACARRWPRGVKGTLSAGSVWAISLPEARPAD